MTPHYPIQFWATKLYVEEGGLIPPWYGFAYKDFDRDTKIFVVFPLNWVVWLWMGHLRYWLLHPPCDKELHRIYNIGYRRGMEATLNRPIIVRSDMDFKSDLPNYK